MHCTLPSAHFSALIHVVKKNAVLCAKLYQPRAGSIRTAVALADHGKLPSFRGGTRLHSYVKKSSILLQNPRDLYSTIFVSCIYCRALSVFEASESDASKLAMPSYFAISLVKPSSCRFPSFWIQFFHKHVQQSHEIISISPQM